MNIASMANEAGFIFETYFSLFSTRGVITPYNYFLNLFETAEYPQR